MRMLRIMSVHIYASGGGGGGGGGVGHVPQFT